MVPEHYNPEGDHCIIPLPTLTLPETIMEVELFGPLKIIFLYKGVLVSFHDCWREGIQSVGKAGASSRSGHGDRDCTGGQRADNEVGKHAW